jgi:hypothetical protein
MLRLGHVSLLHWTKCRIFIGPRGVTTIPRVSFFYSTTCLDDVRLCVSILLGHMSRPKLSTCLFLIQPRGRMDLYHIFCLYWPTCPVMAITRVIHWFVHVPDSYLTTCLCRIYHVHTNHYIRENDSRSILLHKMTTCIIILNLNQIITVQFCSKPLREFTYQAAKISHQNNKQTTCSLHQQDWELPALKSMICSQSLLYSCYCCFLNFSNSLSVFSAFLFSWSTRSARTTELFWWVASRSRSLEQLVLIPTFFKEKVLQLA